MGDNDICPVCVEKFDDTDKGFEPCKCGFQICCWCFNKIMETGDKKCPNCRREYNKENITFKKFKNSKKKKKKKKKKSKKETRNQRTKNLKRKHIPSRAELVNVRVIQRNLVYIVGLTANVAKEDLLEENFAIYGKIQKVVVNRSNLQNPGKLQGIKEPTVSAYITFFKNENAKKAIASVNGTWVDSKMLRCSFGTTKYCSYFLRGVKCNNPECMYLHDYGYEEDTYTKDEIVLKHGLPLPSNKLHEYKVEQEAQKEKHTWKSKGVKMPNTAPPIQPSSSTSTSQGWTRGNHQNQPQPQQQHHHHNHRHQHHHNNHRHHHHNSKHRNNNNDYEVWGNNEYRRGGRGGGGYNINNNRRNNNNNTNNKNNNNTNNNNNNKNYNETEYNYEEDHYDYDSDTEEEEDEITEDHQFSKRRNNNNKEEESQEESDDEEEEESQEEEEEEEIEKKKKKMMMKKK